jgi:penicillin-binding protein 2
MKSKDEKKHQGLDRYILIAVFILAAAGVIIYNLAVIQLIRGDDYKKESSAGSIPRVYLSQAGEYLRQKRHSHRGSRMGYCVQYVDTKMDNAQKNAMILDLIRILDGTGRPSEAALPTISISIPYALRPRTTRT